MATRRLEDLPDGLTAGGAPGALGNVTKIDCLNATTIQNCVNPTLDGHPVTLQYYSSFVPNEWRQLVIGTPPASLLPTFETLFNLEIVLEANGLIRATNSGDGTFTNLSWKIEAFIGGLRKDISLHNQTWTAPTTLYLNEDGTNSPAEFGLNTNGDKIIVDAASITASSLQFHFEVSRLNGVDVTNSWYRYIP